MRVDGKEIEFDEDAIFDKSYSDQQQADLINAINNLLSVYKPNDNSELAAAVNKLSQSHELFLKKINELQAPQINIPETKVNINNDALAKEIKIFNDNAKGLSQQLGTLIKLASAKPKKLKAIRHRLTDTIDYIDVEYENILVNG